MIGRCFKTERTMKDDPKAGQNLPPIIYSRKALLEISASPLSKAAPSADIPQEIRTTPSDQAPKIKSKL